MMLEAGALEVLRQEGALGGSLHEGQPVGIAEDEEAAVLLPILPEAALDTGGNAGYRRKAAAVVLRLREERHKYRRSAEDQEHAERASVS